MADVVIYRTNYCPYCDMAERLLENMGVDFEEVDVTNDPETRRELVDRTGRKTVPQVFINGESVGGFDSLRALKSEGKLEAMLEAE